MHRLLLAALFIVMPFCSWGQAPSGEPQVKEIFENYTNSVFQEKVYVHTDKDSYLAGETMWMRAYRMDAMNHYPMYYSGIVYLDVRDVENKLIDRLVVVRTDSCFQASYKIEPEMRSGYYDLVAYTNWMQNFDSDFYFRKKFYVHNNLDNNISATISFDPQASGGNIGAKVTILDVDGNPYRGAGVNITPYVGEEKQDVIERNINQQGEVSFNLRNNSGVTGVEIAFKGEKPIKYTKYFEVPMFEYAFDVQFMPEGGHLLSGVIQNVGFKAIGSDGKGVDVTGRVTDEAGNEVVAFSSAHLGMGSFMFEPAVGVKYKADVTTGGGHKATFELPQAVASGIALNTSLRGNVLNCKILFTEGYDLASLYLGFQSRGKTYNWVPAANAVNFNLPLASLPEGVLHFFVVDEQGKVYTERIMLINRDSSPQVNLSGLQASYGRRQKVDINLDVIYGGNTPLPSEMSISVVNPATSAKIDNNNIVSYVLMDSDIKGKIENPAYYFDKSIPAAERARNADLLMMTQGWKRFDLGAVLRREVPKLDFAVELGQNISGIIKRRFGNKNVAEGKLSLFGMNKVTNTMIISSIEADPDGRFSVSDISFPDGTTFMVQASQGSKGRQNVELEIEPQVFSPYSLEAWKTRRFYDPQQGAAVDSVAGMMASSERKYYYEDGQRVLALDAATVIGDVEPDDPDVVNYNTYASSSKSGDEIFKEGYSDIKTWLGSQGVQISLEEVEADGMTVSIEQAMIRNRPARVIIDRFPRTHDELFRLPMSEIEGVWIFRDASSLSLVTMESTVGDGRGGIIVKTKSGTGSVPRETTSFVRITPKGYSIPEKFYSPKYETGSKDNGAGFDERSTVYWNPNVKVGRDGKANVSFYTTDVSSTLIMTIQGMTDNGLPVYAEIPVNATF